MGILRIICLITIMTAVLTVSAYAAEPNFSASSLTAGDVDCKKCHADTPHIIHVKKPVDCANCHGDKQSVSIPQCTKCHDGPIHKVHAGKVGTQTCSYCHKNIDAVHNAQISDAVCAHCHSNLTEVHGSDASCTKCHKSPPEIVKPLKAEGMVLVCQNCHPQTSVATIHGGADEKKGCYNCHRGTSKANGSEIPHVIHAAKVDCKGCHEQNKNVIVPQCTACHNIDALHAFNKIGKLTSQSGLKCSVCHPGESGLSAPRTTQPKSEKPSAQNTSGVEPVITETTQETGDAEIPGFGGILATGMLLTGYLLVRRLRR